MSLAHPIVELSSGKGAICGEILATLPGWFSIEAANEGYVRPQFHRRGIGRALMERAEDHARSRAARLLTVKTLAASHPDVGYALTRRFYQAMGFFAVEELPTLWSTENPCLLMAKILD